MKYRMEGRRLAMLLVGIGIMGPGVALFKLSLMGNDPHTALMIAMGDRLGVDFSLVLLCVNCLWFVAEWRFGRELIGIGTFVNWFFVGSLASFSEKAVRAFWEIPAGMGPRLVLMLVGVVTLSLACALYQTADLGVAPYDALSIMLSRGSGQTYFRCRIFTDLLCVIAAFLLGGLLGIGTLVCAVGLGPFIAFFSAKIAQPLISSAKRDQRLWA